MTGTSFHEMKQVAHALVATFEQDPPLATYEEPGCTIEILGLADGYQVTRFTYQPGVRVESHRHDGLRALHFFRRGSVRVWSKGRQFEVNARNCDPLRPSVFVLDGLSHGAEIGPDGLVFISVERHEGEPQPIAGCPHRAWNVEHDRTLESRSIG